MTKSWRHFPQSLDVILAIEGAIRPRPEKQQPQRGPSGTIHGELQRKPILIGMVNSRISGREVVIGFVRCEDRIANNDHSAGRVNRLADAAQG